MPRHVDPIQRRNEITRAAVRILARSGPQSLTLKSLAEELGGSITLVTHYYARRDDLFTAVVDDIIDNWDAELSNLEQGAGPLQRLRILLMWLLPRSEESLDAEGGRVALISHRGEHESIARFFDRMEQRIRELVRGHLHPLLSDVDLEDATGYVRAVINGITLSAVEHPDLWPVAAQERTLELAMLSLGIDLRLAAAPA